MECCLHLLICTCELSEGLFLLNSYLQIIGAWHTYAQQHAANTAVKVWRLEQLQAQLSRGKLWLLQCCEDKFFSDNTLLKRHISP